MSGFILGTLFLFRIVLPAALVLLAGYLVKQNRQEHSKVS